MSWPVLLGICPEPHNGDEPRSLCLEAYLGEAAFTAEYRRFAKLPIRTKTSSISGFPKVSLAKRAVAERCPQPLREMLRIGTYSKAAEVAAYFCSVGTDAVPMGRV